MSILAYALATIATLLSLVLPASATSMAPFKLPAPYVCTRNFYVAPTGTDNATCGAVGSPCASMLGANNATSIGGTGTTLTGGDCVNFAAGTYNIGSTTYLNRYGTNSNANGAGLLTGFITYVGAPNHASIIRTTAAFSFMVQLSSGGHHVIIDGFEFDHNNGGNAGGCSLYTDHNAHHWIVINNIVHDGANSGGICASGGEYYIWDNNEVYNEKSEWDSGISAYEPQVVGSSGTPFDNQTFKIQINNNVTHDNGGVYPGPNGQRTDGNGISFDDWSNHQGNQGNTTAYPNKGIAQGNLSYNNGGDGIQAAFTGNATIVNNSTYHNGTDNVSAGQYDAEIVVFDLTGGYGNNVVKNNATFSFGGAGNPNTQAMTFNQAPINTAAKNLTYMNPTTGTHANCGSSVYLGDGQTCANFTSGNLLDTNPQFVNAAVTTPDFHPQAGSPLLGAGAATPAGAPALMTPDGFPQPTPPNIGAMNGSTPPTSGPVSINSGGPAVTPFVADIDYSGGATVSNGTGTTDLSACTPTNNCAPMLVYQTERYGASFSYPIGGLTPTTSYLLRFHFSEDYSGDAAVGARKNNISVNGTSVLANFDIYATAGNVLHKAVVQEFTRPSDNSGNLNIAITGCPGCTDTNAKIDGLEVIVPAAVTTATLTANPTSVVPGGSSTLTWGSTNATSCTGTNFSTGGASSGSVSVSPSALTTYSVSCTNGGTPATASATVKIVSASLSASPTSITSGNSSTLTWSSSNATSCTGTGFSTGGATSGSVSVSPSVTTNYTVSCTDSIATPTASASVTVNPTSGGLENFPYKVGHWYIPDLMQPISFETPPTRVILSSNANTFLCAPAGQRSMATIGAVGGEVLTTDVNGRFAFGIYTNGSDNRPTSLVATSGSMSTATRGPVSSALSSNVQGGPGGTAYSDKFWICANTNSGKASFASANSTSGAIPSILGSPNISDVLQSPSTGALLSHLRCSDTQCNGGSSIYGTWPNSLGGSTWESGLTMQMPLMVFQFVSVP